VQLGQYVAANSNGRQQQSYVAVATAGDPPKSAATVPWVRARGAVALSLHFGGSSYSSSWTMKNRSSCTTVLTHRRSARASLRRCAEARPMKFNAEESFAEVAAASDEAEEE
jgi:hypothetical protein